MQSYFRFMESMHLNYFDYPVGLDLILRVFVCTDHRSDRVENTLLVLTL